jgi:putative transcriptional regulator
LKEGLTGALAWKRGELALEVVNVDPMPAERIRQIRKKVAKSAKRIDDASAFRADGQQLGAGASQAGPAGRLLLQVIEAAPDVVEKAARQA